MLDLVENEVHFALGVMAGLQHKPLAGSSKSVHYPVFALERSDQFKWQHAELTQLLPFLS
jgi:hypothetical protein